MSSNGRLALFLTLCGGLALLSTGCRDLRSFDEIEEAFENPTGTLDDSSAPDVLTTSILGQEAENANMLASHHGRVPTQVQSAVDFLGFSGDELESSQQALFQECSADVKFSSSMTHVDEVSFDCGDEGEITGGLTLDLDWKDGDLRGFFLDYEMFCDLVSCIDGSMGVRWNLEGAAGTGVTTNLLASARFTVSYGDDSYFVDWAWRIVTSRDEGRFEWLVWPTPDRDEDCYVLSAVASRSGGHLEVRDAQGWWRCDYGQEALDGQCYRCEPEESECVPLEDGNTFSWSTATG